MSLQPTERGAGARSLAGNGASRQGPGTRPERALRLTSGPGVYNALSPAARRPGGPAA